MVVLKWLPTFSPTLAMYEWLPHEYEQPPQEWLTMRSRGVHEVRDGCGDENRTKESKPQPQPQPP